jgi:hypothetical protein
VKQRDVTKPGVARAMDFINETWTKAATTANSVNATALSMTRQSLQHAQQQQAAARPPRSRSQSPAARTSTRDGGGGNIGGGGGGGSGRGGSIREHAASPYRSSPSKNHRTPSSSPGGKSAKSAARGAWSRSPHTPHHHGGRLTHDASSGTSTEGGGTPESRQPILFVGLGGAIQAEESPVDPHVA